MAKRISQEVAKERLFKTEANVGKNLNSEIIDPKGLYSVIKHRCIICDEFKENTLKNFTNGKGLMCLKCSIENLTKSNYISQEKIIERINIVDKSIISEYGLSSSPRIKFYDGTESTIEHNCLLCMKPKDSNFGNYISKTGLFHRDCSYKNLSSKMMHTFDSLLSRLIEHHGDCNFQSIGEYDGRNTLFSFYCTNCKEKETRTFNSLIIGFSLCDKCIFDKRVKKLAFTKEEVKNLIKSHGCTLISGDYINNRFKLEIECICGRPYKCTFAEFCKC